MFLFFCFVSVWWFADAEVFKVESLGGFGDSEKVKGGKKEKMEYFLTACCGKEMKNLGMMDFTNMEATSVRRWICCECLRVIDLIDRQIDEAELRWWIDSGVVAPEQLAD